MSPLASSSSRNSTWFLGYAERRHSCLSPQFFCRQNSATINGSDSGFLIVDIYRIVNCLLLYCVDTGGAPLICVSHLRIFVMPVVLERTDVDGATVWNRMDFLTALEQGSDWCSVSDVPGFDEVGDNDGFRVVQIVSLRHN